MNRSKARGTAAETAVVRTARAHGFPWADRLALHGRLDVGDVSLCPGVMVEVKGGDAARHATDRNIDAWLSETAIEWTNGGAAVALLVVQRTAVGAQNAHRWHAYWRLGWLGQLHDYAIDPWISTAPVRMLYGDALLVLRSAGYGDPLVNGS